MMLLLARFVLVVVILALVVGLILYIAKSSMKDPVVSRYEKRFDPESNQYYIVKINSVGKEEPLTRWYGARIKYKDLIKVQYVVDKMNDMK